MSHKFKVTLSPIAHSTHGLESVTFTAHSDGHAAKRWSLSPYTLAGLLADRFSLEDIVSIETRLHSMEPAELPGEYTSMDLVEMGFRLTKDANFG